jgi:hypothetical protein
MNRTPGLVFRQVPISQGIIDRELKQEHRLKAVFLALLGSSPM